MDVSFRVLMVMETRFLRVVSSEGGDMLSMRSWNFWKDFDCLCWKQTLQATIFFDVSFFTPYFCLILFSTIIYCSTFSEVRCISEVGFRFILLVIFYSQFSSIYFFCFNIYICCFFIYWSGLVVFLLTTLCSVSQRKIFLDDFWIRFYWRTTIISIVIIYCTLVVATVCCNVEFFFLYLSHNPLTYSMLNIGRWCSVPR